jgi:hypothetical protein
MTGPTPRSAPELRAKISSPLDAAFAALTALGCQPVWQRNGSVRSCCPIHERDGRPHHPSLSTFVGRSGRPVWYCHSGCDRQAIRDLLRRHGGIDTASQVPHAVLVAPDGAVSVRIISPWDETAPVGGGWPPAREQWPDGAVQCEHVASYRYTSPCGSWLLGLVDRFHWLDADGTRIDKTFKQRIPVAVYVARAHRSTIAWRPPGGLPLPLYGWPTLYDRNEGALIHLVEGEADCLALWGRGLHAVTAPRGARGWTPAHTAALRQALLPGDTIRLAPDQDEGGTAWRRTRTHALHGTGAVIQ